MTQLSPGWQLDAEQSGDWLVVRVACPDYSYAESPPLAEWIWSLTEQHNSRRLVLEMDRVPVLYSYLIGQLVLLLKRASTQGGALRLCGLSENNQEALHVCRLDDRLPPYRSRQDALEGHYEPRRPR